MNIERTKLPSAANLLLLLGLAALVSSFFIPRMTAERIARIESRGLMIAQTILSVTLEREPIKLNDPDQTQTLIDQLRKACAEQGLPGSYLPELVVDAISPEPSCVYFVSKHHHFLLSREPEPEDTPMEIIYYPEPRRPLEVIAWPRDELAGANSAFYCPEQGLTAYSRNLIARYRGSEHVPLPGTAMPPPGVEPIAGDRRGYRSRGNSERWLPLAER